MSGTGGSPAREKYVTPRYEQWRMDGAVKTKEALRTVYFLRKRDLCKGRSDGSGRFRGSMIGDPCDRKQALSFIGADQQQDRDKRLADAGTTRHYEWQEVGLSAGFLSVIERKVRIGKFAGQVDGITDNGWLFELKTAGNWIFKGTKYMVGVMDSPKPEHVLQCQLYMHALDAPRAVLLYENRDTMELAEWIIHRKPEVAEQVMERIKRIHTMVRGDVLPGMHPLCDESSTMRKYCDFSEQCIARL